MHCQCIGDTLSLSKIHWKVPNSRNFKKRQPKTPLYREHIGKLNFLLNLEEKKNKNKKKTHCYVHSVHIYNLVDQ